MLALVKRTGVNSLKQFSIGKDDFKFDLELFLRCCEQAGVKVTKPGKGGVYINGKELTNEELIQALEGKFE